MPKINPRIKSIDDLLGLDAAEERPIEPTPSVSLPTKNTIITLPPQAIRAFRGHPFRLYEGDRLNDLVESISEHGVLNPAIIRKIERDEDGFEYEMLAGHNRQNAAAIANRELPCIVKENLSDEDAWIYVIETNVLQRSFSEMLPSEKAAVLALRYSKMICQGRRNDIVEELKRLENPDEIRENGTCGIECHKSKSRDVVGAEYDLKGRAVANYLRINELITPLKRRIDDANGASISPTTGNYDYYTPATPMPRIVSSGSQNASIEAIKKYFCSEYAVKLVAQQTGIAYEELIGGQYKLFLEPIAYFKHNGIMMAMTAHEAALYDNQAGGSLRKTMTSLTHKNLPLAMFLEYADMGFPAYTGATNKTCSNDTIITYLGMGIVWFTDPPEQPEPTDYDYEYRVDTDVITPVTLYAGSEINPDSPATVSFSINGSTYRMNNIVIPSGDSQIAWVKWHTPSEPQDITIYVSTNKGSLSQSTIHAKVVDLSGNDPPDPKATDTMGSWSASSIPSRETKTYAAWSVWWAKWHPYWVWHSTGKNTGYWVDDGWYDYFRDNYSASMTATTRIEPDEKVPTASGDLMKSGYGVTNTVTATVSTSAPLSHYTYGQTAVSYFPEFGYGTYWRLLERLTSGTTARFQFAKNIYSTYNQRVHFSPVWFPDGSYTVNTHVMDIWTPAGMLAMNLTDDVTISGSLYDDWHIAPGNP